MIAHALNHILASLSIAAARRAAYIDRYSWGGAAWTGAVPTFAGIEVVSVQAFPPRTLVVIGR